MVKRKKQSKRVIWQDVIPAQTMPVPRIRKPANTIEIKISLPRFFTSKGFLRFKSKLSKIPKKAWIIGLMLVAVATAGLISYYQFVENKTADNSNNGVEVRTDADSNQPKYPTITPSGKDINQLGGWTRVSPIDRNPVFAYVDHIGNIPINVSQQPLPDEFSDDTIAQINLLAAGYNANEKITVGNTSVHIGTSAKGPQSVIFTKNGLLVLIKSSAKISSDSWATYINSLH